MSKQRSIDKSFVPGSFSGTRIVSAQKSNPGPQMTFLFLQLNSEMPRKAAITNSIGPYHISARCINKEWFNLHLDSVWETFSNHLYFLCRGFNFQIHSFVLMNNHYHLLASTPQLNISSGMAYFHREVSRELNKKGNRINRTFAGRYFKCHIGSFHYFMNCYKYVYQNPVRSGVVRQCESYPYSTLSGLLGLSRMEIPVVEDTLLFEDDLHNTLCWLNETPEKVDLDSMRSAINKGEFKLRKDLKTKKPNRLEMGLL